MARPMSPTNVKTMRSPSPIEAAKIRDRFRLPSASSAGVAAGTSAMLAVVGWCPAPLPSTPVAFIGTATLPAPAAAFEHPRATDRLLAPASAQRWPQRLQLYRATAIRSRPSCSERIVWVFRRCVRGPRRDRNDGATRPGGIEVLLPSPANDPLGDDPATARSLPLLDRFPRPPLGLSARTRRRPRVVRLRSARRRLAYSGGLMAGGHPRLHYLGGIEDAQQLAGLLGKSLIRECSRHVLAPVAPPPGPATG